MVFLYFFSESLNNGKFAAAKEVPFGPWKLFFRHPEAVTKEQDSRYHFHFLFLRDE